MYCNQRGSGLNELLAQEYGGWDSIQKSNFNENRQVNILRKSSHNGEDKISIRFIQQKRSKMTSECHALRAPQV
jgi:hypothetical protein